MLRKLYNLKGNCHEQFNLKKTSWTFQVWFKAASMQGKTARIWRAVACWQGGGEAGGSCPPPSEDFLGGAKIQRGRQNCWKALVKTFVTILESDEPMKEKWSEFHRDLRSVWQCLCLCVCQRHTTLTTTATPCARAPDKLISNVPDFSAIWANAWSERLLNYTRKALVSLHSLPCILVLKVKNR